MITENDCRIEALKYDKRIDFQKYSAKIYNYARNINILDDICKHMIFEKIDFNINEIDLLKFSPKYDNKQRLFFIILSKNIDDTYDIQFNIDNLIIKNVTKDDIIKGKIYHPNKIKYKVEHRITQFFHLIFDKAKRFNTRREFEYYFPNEYRKAKKTYKNDLDIICGHMPEKIHFWSFDEVKNEAKKYKFLKDFYTNSPKAYKAAIYNGWLKLVTTHMETPNIKELPHMVYAYEFNDKSVYIGLTRNLEKRINIRNNDYNDAVNLHMRKTKLIPKLIEISKYIKSEKAQLLEITTIENYKNNGWKILNRREGGGLGGYKLINEK